MSLNPNNDIFDYYNQENHYKNVMKSSNLEVDFDSVYELSVGTIPNKHLFKRSPLVFSEEQIKKHSIKMESPIEFINGVNKKLNRVSKESEIFVNFHKQLGGEDVNTQDLNFYRNRNWNIFLREYSDLRLSVNQFILDQIKLNKSMSHADVARIERLKPDEVNIIEELQNMLDIKEGDNSSTYKFLEDLDRKMAELMARVKQKSKTIYKDEKEAYRRVSGTTPSVFKALKFSEVLVAREIVEEYLNRGSNEAKESSLERFLGNIDLKEGLSDIKDGEYYKESKSLSIEQILKKYEQLPKDEENLNRKNYYEKIVRLFDNYKEEERAKKEKSSFKEVLESSDAKGSENNNLVIEDSELTKKISFLGDMSLKKFLSNSKNIYDKAIFDAAHTNAKMSSSSIVGLMLNNNLSNSYDLLFRVNNKGEYDNSALSNHLYNSIAKLAEDNENLLISKEDIANLNKKIIDDLRSEESMRVLNSWADENKNNPEVLFENHSAHTELSMLLKDAIYNRVIEHQINKGYKGKADGFKDNVFVKEFLAKNKNSDLLIDFSKKFREQKYNISGNFIKDGDKERMIDEANKIMNTLRVLDMVNNKEIDKDTAHGIIDESKIFDWMDYDSKRAFEDIVNIGFKSKENDGYNKVFGKDDEQGRNIQDSLKIRYAKDIYEEFNKSRLFRITTGGIDLSYQISTCLKDAANPNMTRIATTASMVSSCLDKFEQELKKDLEESVRNSASVNSNIMSALSGVGVFSEIQRVTLMIANMKMQKMRFEMESKILTKLSFLDEAENNAELKARETLVLGGKNELNNDIKRKISDEFEIELDDINESQTIVPSDGFGQYEEELAKNDIILAAREGKFDKKGIKKVDSISQEMDEELESSYKVEDPFLKLLDKAQFIDKSILKISNPSYERTVLSLNLYVARLEKEIERDLKDIEARNVKPEAAKERMESKRKEINEIKELIGRSYNTLVSSEDGFGEKILFKSALESRSKVAIFQDELKELGVIERDREFSMLNPEKNGMEFKEIKDSLNSWVKSKNKRVEDIDKELASGNKDALNSEKVEILDNINYLNHRMEKLERTLENPNLSDSARRIIQSGILDISRMASFRIKRDVLGKNTQEKGLGRSLVVAFAVKANRLTRLGRVSSYLIAEGKRDSKYFSLLKKLEKSDLEDEKVYENFKNEFENLDVSALTKEKIIQELKGMKSDLDWRDTSSTNKQQQSFSKILKNLYSRDKKVLRDISPVMARKVAENEGKIGVSLNRFDIDYLSLSKEKKKQLKEILMEWDEDRDLERLKEIINSKKSYKDASKEFNAQDSRAKGEDLVSDENLKYSPRFSRNNK
jgi:hypothetical protein